MILTKKRVLKAHSCIKKLGLALLLILTQFQLVHANTAVEGWNFGSPITNGTKTTWNATKEVAGKVVTGVVSIKPTPAQVAKGILKGGLVGIALTATEQLLEDGVDFVLDPANNTIRYKQKVVGRSCGNSGVDCTDIEYYWNTGVKGYSGSTYQTACSAYIDYFYSYNPNNFTYTLISCDLINENKANLNFSYNHPFGQYQKTASVIRERNQHYISSSDKSTPITVTASQIITQAESGNKEAQDYISTVAQDLLEHDEDVKRAVVAELDKSSEETKSEDDKKKCPSGIISPQGQCWVCDRSDHPIVTQRTQVAKKELSQLGKCLPEMENTELFKRINVFNEFIQARVNENSCWSPPDLKHIQQEQDGKNGVAKCKKYLR